MFCFDARIFSYLLAILVYAEGKAVSVNMDQQLDHIKHLMGIRNERYLKTVAETLQKKISSLATAERETRVFYLDKKSIPNNSSNLPELFYSKLLADIGWSHLRKIISKEWEHVITINDQLTDSSNQHKECQKIIHPDHLLSQVIFENTIYRVRLHANEIEDLMKKLFCPTLEAKTSLYCVKSHDVLSGMVLLRLQKNGSAFAFVNIGF